MVKLKKPQQNVLVCSLKNLRGKIAYLYMCATARMSLMHCLQGWSTEDFFLKFLV